MMLLATESMSRYVSYRDFDWVLLGFVLAICALGVFQIHSATEHTKFAGSHIRQIYWILGGLGRHVSGQPGQLSGSARTGALDVHRFAGLADCRCCYLGRSTWVRGAGSKCREARTFSRRNGSS